MLYSINCTYYSVPEPNNILTKQNRLHNFNRRIFYNNPDIVTQIPKEQGRDPTGAELKR